MRYMTLVAAIILFTLFVLAPLAGRAMLDKRTDGEVRELFQQAQSLDGKIFTHDQLRGLPKPVQEYFKHVLDEGQPYISYLRLRHDGWFKTGPDKKAMKIRGEQYFTASHPGFIWIGKTRLFTARDMYIRDKGRLVVSLLSLFKVADHQGPGVDQAELLRWLGESVWFPTNLLPGENLQWSAIDSSHARLTYTHNGLSVYYVVAFNGKNEITQMATQRHMEDRGLQPWVGKVGGYREVDGVRVPGVIEASWDLEDGRYTYGRFKVQQFEYNIPEKF